jgi:leader peptidase (prepilin peptidase)/N-methyltransferase
LSDATAMPTRFQLGVVYWLGFNALMLPALKHGDLTAPLLLASVGLGIVLAALSAIDTIEMRLPDALTLPLLAAGLVMTGLGGWDPIAMRALAAAAGFLLLFVVAAAYRLWRGKDGLGLGDAKLLAAAGAWLGLGGLPSVLLWASLSALLAALVLHFAGRKISGSTAIPFGPFIALGFWLVWLHGPLA